MTLVTTLLTIFGAALLSGIFSCAITLLTMRHQKKSDELAYKRATADRKRTELYPAYKVMRRLVRAFEALYAAIEENLREDNVEIAQHSLIDAMIEAEEAQGAYMLVDKEAEIHAALQALYSAFTNWVSTRKTFYSLKDDLNSVGDSLTMLPYETVKKAKEEFEARRDAFLTLAKAWEKELP